MRPHMMILPSIYIRRKILRESMSPKEVNANPSVEQTIHL